MKEPFVNELRNLRPHLRRGFIAGTHRYRSQEKEVRVEDDNLRKLELAGIADRRAGRRSVDHLQVLTRDTLRRDLHISVPDEG